MQLDSIIHCMNHPANGMIRFGNELSSGRQFVPGNELSTAGQFVPKSNHTIRRVIHAMNDTI